MSKDTHTLNLILDGIWRRGDRDEESIKHIGHALAAIIAFGDWTKGVDYELPQNWFSELDHVNTWRRDNLRKQITPRWAKVMAMYERLGKEAFTEVVSESKFGFYPMSYLESSWLGYSSKDDLAKAG